MTAFSRRSVLAGALLGATGVLKKPQLAEAGGAARPIRLLCIDGGGMRGVIPAQLLQELEKITGKRTAELFDAVIGTSTGSLLAMGVNAPDENGRSKYAADELVSLYDEFGPVIFHKERGPRRYFKSIFRPTYDPSDYERLLEEYFGLTMLRDAILETAVPSISLDSNKMEIFSRRAARENSMNNFFMKDLVRAATAAPSYFPAAKISSVDGIQAGHFIDASIAINNPGLLALAEAKVLAPTSPIVMMSIGTGTAPSSIDPVRASNWGELEWLTVLLELQRAAQASFTHDVLSESLTDKRDSIFRFQVNLGDVPHQMDITTPAHMADLKRLALEELSRRRADFEAIAERLSKV